MALFRCFLELLQLQTHLRESGQFEMILCKLKRLTVLFFFSQARAKLKSTKLSLHWKELFENTGRMKSSQAIVCIIPSSRENLNLPRIWTATVPEDISIITWLPNIHFDHNHCLKLLLIPIQVKP